MKPECKIDSFGTKYWCVNGKLHREDGPAIEYADGTKFWYINNKLHREDGPAIEYSNGTKYWCVNGKLHREDGPAVEHFRGFKEWWINGKEISEEEFIRIKRYCRTCNSLLSFTKAINQYIIYCPKCQR